MGKISICLGIYTESFADSENSSAYLYKTAYKAIASFLYANPDFPFSFFFTGTVLEWLQKTHKEYLVIIEELISRKQVEILGGAYYNAILPLLPHIDRVGQIEYLNTFQRKVFKKRPKGAWLFTSAWENSMISSLTSGSMEYALLDYTLFASENEKKAYQPAITDDLGKSILILPSHSDLINIETSAESFFAQIAEKVPENTENANVCCFFSIEKLQKLLENRFFAQIDEYLKNNPDCNFELSLPYKSVKSSVRLNKICIASGISRSAALWAQQPFVQAAKLNARITTQDFLLLYPEILNLYSRMLYTSAMTNQCHGDKMRKKAAKQMIWQAQCGEVYNYLGKNGISNQFLRQKTYQTLIQTEKLAREAGNFSESIGSLDLNCDGIKEYVAQFDQYSAFLSKLGGSIYEFDAFECNHNFANLLCGNFQRKFFTDYLASEKEFEALCKGENLAAAPVLCQNLYSETKFDRIKKCVKLESDVRFGKNATIKILKEFKFTKDSVRVDYKMANTGDKPLVAWFVVENNFSFADNSEENLSADCSGETFLQKFSGKNAFCRQKEDIFYVRLNDLQNESCFTISSSNPAGFYSYPNYENQLYSATSAGLFWKASILPGQVFSRTITMYMKFSQTEKKLGKK